MGAAVDGKQVAVNWGLLLCHANNVTRCKPLKVGVKLCHITLHLREGDDNQGYTMLLVLSQSSVRKGWAV